jgi:hypothetical protein
MLVPVSPKHRRRRRLPRETAALTTPALALTGIDAFSVIAPDIEMNLLFNVTGADLLADVSAADPAKWTARFAGTRYVGTFLVNVAPDILYLQMSPAGAEALAYSNAPSDVSDSLGRFLAALTAETH